MLTSKIKSSKMHLIKKSLLCITLLWILFFGTAKGQVGTVSNSASATITVGITEVSLLKANQGLVNLLLNQQDAGLSIEVAKSDSTTRLLLSSVITSTPRTLSAKITTGTVPLGTHLELVVLQPNTNYVGNSGIFAPPIILDQTDKPIVTDIGTCYSGTGASDGYPIKFIFKLDDNANNYGNIRATTGIQIIVTFTLSGAD